MPFDVVVVGAGPVGTTAAGICAKAGLETLCIEEHGTIGFPVQCAGLLSTAAFRECGVSDRSVQNKISGARVESSMGHEILFDAKQTKAVVVDRCALDHEMAETAANEGAEFKLKTSVYDVKGGTVFTRGPGGHEEFSFRILIAADGPRATIARLYGMERAKVYLSGIQADIPFDCDRRFVQLYPDASPEFFGWAIPTAEGRLRVGLCGQTHVPEKFNKLMSVFGPNATTHLVTGTLPLGLMPRTYGRRTLFAGDCAGFAKPTSGGGVYTGVRAARHAAEVAVLACERNQFDDRFLAEYERRWRADIGRELDLGFRLFRMRQQMSSEQIDALIRALGDPEILTAIVKYGDMDRPSAIAALLLKKPAILRCLGSLIPSGIRSFFR